MFSVRSRSENPRSPDSPWRRWSPPKSIVRTPRSTPRATVLLPAADIPVNQRTNALCPIRSAERGVDPELPDRMEQRHCLKCVAARLRTRLLPHAPPVDRVLHGADGELKLHIGGETFPELDHLGKVVAGVGVKEREGGRCRVERLACEPGQHRRVLPPREEDDRPLELGGYLTEEVDRLGLENPEMTPHPSLPPCTTPCPAVPPAG